MKHLATLYLHRILPLLILLLWALVLFR